MRIKSYINDKTSLEQNRYSLIANALEVFVNFSLTEGELGAIKRYNTHLFLLHSCCLFSLYNNLNEVRRLLLFRFPFSLPLRLIDFFAFFLSLLNHLRRLPIPCLYGT